MLFLVFFLYAVRIYELSLVEGFGLANMVGSVVLLLLGIVILTYFRYKKIYLAANHRTLQVLACLFVGILVFAATSWGTIRSARGTGPHNDIGETTVDAVQLMMEGENPYDTPINKKYNVTSQRGYKYGPVMMASYIPLFRGVSIQTINAVYVFLTVLAFIALIRKTTSSHALRHKVGVLVAVFLVSTLFRYELFYQGVIDIVPVFLIVTALLTRSYGRIFFTGVLLGLSMAAKPAPAVFVALLLGLKKDIPRKFRGGCVIGALPVVTALLCRGEPVIHNFLLYNAFKPADASSLVYYLPDHLQPLAGFVFLVMLGYILHRNAFSDQSMPQTVANTILVLLLAIVTYKEIHANYYVWIIPLAAYVLATLHTGSEKQQPAFTPMQ